MLIWNKTSIRVFKVKLNLYFYYFDISLLLSIRWSLLRELIQYRSLFNFILKAAQIALNCRQQTVNTRRSGLAGCGWRPCWSACTYVKTKYINIRVCVFVCVGGSGSQSYPVYSSVRFGCTFAPWFFWFPLPVTRRNHPNLPPNDYSNKSAPNSCKAHRFFRSFPTTT